MSSPIMRWPIGLFFVVFIPIFIATQVTVSHKPFYKFRAIHGHNVRSIRSTLAISIRKVKTECIAACLTLFNCGGFNYRRLESGNILCDLKPGVSLKNKTRQENGTTYYEKAGQNASMVSRDCTDLQDAGVIVSGVYDVNINPEGIYPGLVPVYCDMDKAGGGWTVLLRREDGSVDFNRAWIDYKNGFGNMTGEFWIGLESMHRITNNGKSYMVRVDMRLFTGEYGFAEYSTFSVSSETVAYKLSISGYTGNTSDSFSYHNGMRFSTPDNDNDLYSYNCADLYNCGFWFKDCSRVRLTGLYGEDQTYNQGILWFGWLDAHTHPQYVEMKIKSAG